MRVNNNIFGVFGRLAVAAGLVVASSSCAEQPQLFTDGGVPSPNFLYVTVEETSIDIDSPETTSFSVDVESTGDYKWSVTSNAEWCVVPQAEYNGSNSVNFELTEVNRTDLNRTATITLTLVTDYSTVTDKFTVTQMAFPYAMVAIDATESAVWADAGEVPLELSYNNSLTVKINYLTDGEQDWITLPEEPLEELFGAEKMTLDYIFAYDEYTADPGSTRVAEVVFTNNVLHGETSEVVETKYTLTQSVELIVRDPAVTTFSDNFNYITANGATYAPADEIGWTTSGDLKTYYAAASNWTNVIMYQAEAETTYIKWLIAPAVNPADAPVKKISFWWSGANVNNATPNARLEVVYTTDAVGADLNAPEWITIGEVDYAELGIAWTVKKLYEVVFDGSADGTDGDEYRTALDAFAKEKWVQVGLRYTSGGKMGYRVDDFRFGVEAASVADTAE